ncbi:uncharacterized protein LOC107370717 [Tetranychus urticae]|uniref:Bcl-2 Bcl-2 homology region 1-3 domain-containing protein n=1 Tax=Tetranychus urticae TaxID=32264 RepID=T1KKH7_TETUR|nr:uncharacterized protein LOC107370717 [Tetranychus urticae]
MALVDNDIEIVVFNYFRQQFALKDVQWTPPYTNRPAQAEEQIINRFVEVLNQLTTDFRSTEGFSELIDKLDSVTHNLDRLPAESFDDSGYAVFTGIAEHLFAEGIKWCHILTLFVFAFELANEFLRIKDDTAVVECIANWLILYTSERLLDWINDHQNTE